MSAAEPTLYHELAEWWPLFSAPGDYADEAAIAEQVLREHARRGVHDVLELGSGGGNNASHLRRAFTMTLVDLSDEMLAVSGALNPDCEHVQGDMRTVRLGRDFDAVFAHDAVMYMLTVDDLLAAATTARVHCRPGGVALFVPDCTRESFVSRTGTGGHDARESGRALRYLEWVWDPDPADHSYLVDFAILLHEHDGGVRRGHRPARFGVLRPCDLARRAPRRRLRRSPPRNRARVGRLDATRPLRRRGRLTMGRRRVLVPVLAEPADETRTRRRI